MTGDELDFVAALLRRRSGLVIGADKRYLVESRLEPVARRAGLASLTALVARLQNDARGTLADAVVEAMTINESYFFRDRTPFDRLADTMLPALLAARARQRRIRIWCAAASAGQEPYSVAMVLAGMASRLAGWRVDILATDLSTDVLERAKAGVFTQFEVQRGLPIQHLLQHFEKTPEGWRIAPQIRAMVEFRRFNLLDSFAALGGFDIVFCRNVLIYFDVPTKADVLNRLARVIAEDGYLVLGATETIIGLTDSLEPRSDPRSCFVPSRAAPAFATAAAV